MSARWTPRLRPLPPRTPTQGTRSGSIPRARFRVVVGASADGLLRQALWYFRDETIAVPVAGMPVSSFTPGVRTFDDVRQWAAARARRCAARLSAARVGRRRRTSSTARACPADGAR